MAILEILQYPDARLNHPAQRVEKIDAATRKLIDDMIETMYAAPGVGLAAPQVGVALRMFVVDVSIGRDPNGLMTFINPEFVERDGTQIEDMVRQHMQPRVTAAAANPQP